MQYFFLYDDNIDLIVKASSLRYFLKDFGYSYAVRLIKQKLSRVTSSTKVDARLYMDAWNASATHKGGCLKLQALVENFENRFVVFDPRGNYGYI